MALFVVLMNQSVIQIISLRGILLLSELVNIWISPIDHQTLRLS